MASQLHNNISDSLANSIDDVQTSFDLSSGSVPSLDSGDYIPIYVIRASDNAFEIMHVIGVSGSTVTVDRAKEPPGDSPLTFNSGDRVEIRPTRQSLLEMGIDIGEKEVTTSSGTQALSSALDTRVAWDDGELGSQYPSGDGSQISNISRNSPFAKSLSIDDAMFSWWAKPIFVRHNDDAFFTFTTHQGGVGVAQFSYSSGRVKTKVLSDDFNADDHNAGSIAVSDNNLTVFFPGRQNRTDSANLYYAEASEPDVDSLGSLQSVSTSDTETNYPNSYAVDSSLFVTYRTSAGTSNWNSRVNSYPLGAWQTERVFFDSTLTWPYFATRRSRLDSDEINFALGWHPENESHANIYVGKFKGDSATPWDVVSGGVVVGNLSDGTGLPLNEGDFELAYTSSVDEKTRLFDVHDGCFAFASYTGDGSDAQYTFAYFDGTSWQSSTIVAAGNAFNNSLRQYYGGVAIDDLDKNIIYLSRQEDNIWHLEEWRSEDDGATWSFYREIDSGYDVTARPMAEVVSQSSSKEIESRKIYFKGRYDHTDFTKFYTKLVTEGQSPVSTDRTGEYIKVGETVSFSRQGSDISIPVKLPEISQFIVRIQAVGGPAPGSANAVRFNPNGTILTGDIRAQFITGEGTTLAAAESLTSGDMTLTSQSGTLFCANLHIYYSGRDQNKMVQAEVGGRWGDGDYLKRLCTFVWVDTSTVWDFIGTIDWVNAPTTTQWHISVTRVL